MVKTTVIALVLLTATAAYAGSRRGLFFFVTDAGGAAFVPAAPADPPDASSDWDVMLWDTDDWG